MRRFLFSILSIIIFSFLFGQTETPVADLYLLFGQTETPVADLYLAPDGDDAAAGSRSAPLKTFQGAVEKARTARTDGRRRTITINVAPGLYPVDRAIALGPGDGDLRFIAEKPGHAIVSGGKTLPPFREERPGLWKIRLTEHLPFEQLWVGGRRAIRARTPNTFYRYMKEPVDEIPHPLTGETADLSRTAFIGFAEDLAPLRMLAPEELTNVYVRVFQSWCQGVSRVTYFDPGKNILVMTPGTGRPFFFWMPYLPRYILENYRGALDAPGEWFHDRKENTLYYIPRAGETLATARAVIPVAEQLLTLTADRAKGESLENVHFRGITFRYAALNLPDGILNGQAATAAPAAILCSGAENFSFESCRIVRVGGHAVRVRNGCRRFTFSRNLIEDCGAGGLYIGDTHWSPETKETSFTCHGLADNNIIRDGGHLLTAGIGVWIGHAAAVTVSRNDIGDFRYTGVSSGWTWGYRETANENIRILRNRIHHIGQGVLSDMGGVYTLGDHRDSVVIGNEIHDIWSYDYTGRGGWGLYTDEGSANLLFESNLVHRVKTGAVHQHYGKGNIFRNNILAFSKANMIQHSRVEKHLSFRFENNIVLWDNDTRAVSHASGDLAQCTKDLLFRNNIYWSTVGIAANAFQHHPFKEWQAAGQDAGSLIADPQLEDPVNGKWMPKKGSPAYTCGFRPFDTSGIGVYGDAAWKREAARPVKPVAFAPVPPRFVRTRYATSFEAPTSGMRPPALFGSSCAAGHGAYVRRVKTAANTGHHALEFRDSPTLKIAYHPHLYGAFRATNGTVTVSQSVKGDEKTDFTIEFRDYMPDTNREYISGPIYNYRRNAIYVRGKKITDVTPGQWVKLTVMLDLSTAAGQPRTWTLDVTPRGGKTVKSGPFVCPPFFRELEWIGWLSLAREKTSLFLDDFSYAVK